MATLTIRNLPQELHDRLRRRAANHRRSMESEARELLRQQLADDQNTEDRSAALAELREMGRQWRARAKVPKGWSMVDQDVAERHLEGAWEDRRVTDAERQDWLDRLHAFEVCPAELEAFVASRTP
jgi:antitoxin FitA